MKRSLDRLLIFIFCAYYVQLAYSKTPQYLSKPPTPFYNTETMLMCLRRVGLPPESKLWELPQNKKDRVVVCLRNISWDILGRLPSKKSHRIQISSEFRCEEPNWMEWNKFCA
ncbi:uncharacterized protein LOC135833473 [Planococcus citri]|uniref:uncharacterized protein LOC135833473 n=1 Tax=Planococcus citri TaxID=170843 RepID=UPI0031F99253